MGVFVKSMRGEPLMPTTERKARILLREKKAEIVGYTPFTIQLQYPTGEAVQPVDVGVDTGARHMGIAVTSGRRVCFRARIDLRQDVHGLLETRKALRHGRRNRKTRYRPARFRNRRKPDGWLPPSIQSRLDNQSMWIDRIRALLPDPQLHIEVGKFDPAKMINPGLEGDQYQQGPAAGYHDVRYFVFARDNYTCQVCKRKGGILQTHHIVHRSNGGTDRADNLITVCKDCHTHANHQPGGILYRWQEKGKKVRPYREPTFMNILRRRICERYPDARITYGSVTASARTALHLPKSHTNDAIAISGIPAIARNAEQELFIIQVRTKKRSLHEATARKGRGTNPDGSRRKNTGQKREKKNTPQCKRFRLSDKVRTDDGRTGHITGFTGSNAYIVGADGRYIRQEGKTYLSWPLTKLTRICHNRNWVGYTRPAIPPTA